MISVQFEGDWNDFSAKTALVTLGGRWVCDARMIFAAAMKKQNDGWAVTIHTDYGQMIVVRREKKAAMRIFKILRRAIGYYK